VPVVGFMHLPQSRPELFYSNTKLH
jgi:hypothetical protein